MTTKRTKPKPVKMWAIFGEDGWVVEIAATKHGAVRAALAWNLSDHVHRVLVTPIEPKKRGEEMTRAELIAALEAAPGPSRELFVEAYRIAHNLENWQGRDPLSFARFAELLDAEAWLDAAMTLVPGDLDWALGSSRGVPTYNAFLFQRDDNSTHAGEAYHAKTPAIALCAAALKAGEGKEGP